MICKPRFATSVTSRFATGVALTTVAALGMAFCLPAHADRITHPTAVFSGLDKITGRIISFEVASNETVQFGSLQITERACFTRSATEAPQTITFAEIDEVDAKKQYKRIFSGWMFASSPGLNGIEHPVYDIWLTDCKGGTEVQKTPGETADSTPATPANADAQAKDAVGKDPIGKDTSGKDVASKDTAKDAAKEAAKEAKAERRKRKAEENARQARRRQQQDDAITDNEPRRDAGREPPSRSFFPDATGGRDPGGFY